jgi:[acyl-carrier-protein] S-malonyltransferase
VIYPPNAGVARQVWAAIANLAVVLDPTPTALLFPGQGSQTNGMAGLVATTRPDLFEAVCELVGDDPFQRVDESTRYAQPAIFCASLASWTRIADRVTPVVMAGHSLGELSALAAAGAVDEFDALRLVVLRAELMADSGQASGDGTMLALIGSTPARAAALAARHRVFVANDNAPDQVVLSGDRADLTAAAAAAKRDGLRAISLSVTGAFHSPHMAAAVGPFRAALDGVEFRTPAIPVVSCASAKPFADPAAELAAALVRPVRWRETMQTLAAAGANTFIDVGPGRVLARLAPRCVAGVAAATADTLLESADVAA